MDSEMDMEFGSDMDSRGYVIRCFDLMGTGEVHYLGAKNELTRNRDSIPLSRTYTLTGARKAIAYLRNSNSGGEYCIERLSMYYPKLTAKCTTPKKQALLEELDRAERRLDELWEGKDRGDKMRINEIRRILDVLRGEVLR